MTAILDPQRLDPERLARARALSARLTDTQLAQELKGDPDGLEPEAVLALQEEAKRRSKARLPLILSTTGAVGRPIRRVIAIVGAEQAVRIDQPKDTPAPDRHIVGRRANPMQEAFRQAREEVLRELNARGAALHADAVVGISFTVSEWSGQGKNLLLLLATGTAVELDSSASAA